MTFLHIIVPCLTEAFSATSMYRMHRIRHNLHDGHSKHDIYAILIIIYQQLTNIELCLCVWEKRVPVKPKSEIEQFLVCFFKLSLFYRHESGPINNIMKDYHFCLESVKAKTNFQKIMNLKVFFLNNTLKSWFMYMYV